MDGTIVISLAPRSWIACIIFSFSNIIKMNVGEIKLALKAKEIIDLKWWQFSKRSRLHQEAIAIAKEWCLEY